jgi:hypothetical protein
MNSQLQNDEPQGRPYETEANWRMIGLISLGISLGALIGAGVALLTAPRSGAHTRLALAREFRRHRPSMKTNVFNGLGDGIGKRFGRQARRLKGMEI